MGPPLWEMVENTTPHPEASAYGNTQVNDASPRCLRQKHSFTYKVVYVQQINTIPFKYSWMALLCDLSMRNVKPSQLPSLSSHAQKAMSSCVCLKYDSLRAKRESKPPLKPSGSILWLVMPILSRKSCRGIPFHPCFPLQKCPYVAAPKHQPKRLGEMLLSWEQMRPLEWSEVNGQDAPGIILSKSFQVLSVRV